MIMVGACVSSGFEVIVAASALEKILKLLLLIPPLAEAWCGAIDIRIAKQAAKVMLRPFSWHLSEVRIMIVYPCKYNHDGKL